MEKVIFYILAAIMIIFSIMSVTSRKMLRSVIYLLFVLCGAAGVYFLIDYNFLAAIQLTIYAGGIIVLIIFSVLLVHQIEMKLELAKPSRQWFTALACVIGLGFFLITIYGYSFDVVENTRTITTDEVGNLLLSYTEGGFILPFEVISVLLLAAMVGAIIIAKGKQLSIKNEATK